MSVQQLTASHALKIRRGAAYLKGFLMNSFGFKTPPHNIEAEQALLGALLLDNAAYDAVTDFVAPYHFYEPLHGRIFQGIGQLIADGGRADYLTMKALMAGEPPIGKGKDQISPMAYLGKLAANATSVVNARDYAEWIRRMYELRQLAEIGEDLGKRAYDVSGKKSVVEHIEAAEAALYALSRQGEPEGGKQSMISDSAERALAMIMAAYQRNAELFGLSTGFRHLDLALGGLAPSDLLILAGRPSMGKSALACNIAFNVARRLVEEFRHPSDMLVPGHKRAMGEVSIYSLEMSAEQLVMREMSGASGVPVEAMRRGLSSNQEKADRDFQAIQRAAKDVGALPIYINSTGALSIAKLAAEARRRKRIFDTRLIVIDYLQLMTTGERYSEGRTADVTKITMALKSLAKDVDVPVIALSQLSRAVETRPDKRPQLSDLRESGSIEQDADVVMFVYREEYYLKRTEPTPADKPDVIEEWNRKFMEAQGKAEVILGKHRHGAITTVRMGFEGKYTRFVDGADSENKANQ